MIDPHTVKHTVTHTVKHTVTHTYSHKIHPSPLLIIATNEIVH